MVRLRESFKTVLTLFTVVQFQRPSADLLGCFKDDSETPGFRYIPDDLDPAWVTPQTCLHACSTRYKYAAIANENLCLCGLVVNSTMKVDDRKCSNNHTSCYGSHVCEHVMHYDVYWRRHGIVGLQLHIDNEVELFSRTWLNASVLGPVEVEFRFKIDDRIISSWSNSSTVSHIFMEKDQHLVQVTARNNLSNESTVETTLNVLDRFQNEKFHCPNAAIPGNEIACSGQWRSGSGNVEFNYGNGVSENIYFDTSVHVHNSISKLNGSQSTLAESQFVGTYVTALNPGPGEISLWSIIATKPGNITVQILRPYCNTTEEVASESCLSKLNNSNHNLDTITLDVSKSLCLTDWWHDSSNLTQNTSSSFVIPWYNSTGIIYEVVSNEILHIPNIGSHLFPSTKGFTLERNDVIGWSSGGGQLSYFSDETRVTLEYPVIGQVGTKLQVNSYAKMAYGTHALAAYVRKPLKFELHYTYEKPGVYHIRSSETPTFSIAIDYSITPFTLNLPKLSPTNTTVFFVTGLHNGTGVTYSWNFGDSNTINSSKSNTTHVYIYPGRYLISLYARNSVSDFAVNGGIDILDPIRDCCIQPIGAVALGKPINLTWHCVLGSNVTFSVNFDDGNVIEFPPTSDKFVGNNYSYMYSAAGYYKVKIVGSNPLGVNVSFTEETMIEIPVEGLELRLLKSGHHEAVYIATFSGISVERVLTRGSHVNCTFHFGDSELPITTADAIVNHTYRTPGNYHVNVTCRNHVSSAWAVLNSTVIVENISPLKNLTLKVTPTVFGETSKFKLVIPYGNFYRCQWDLGDNTKFNTSYPNMTIPSHRFRDVGAYIVFVSCRNVLGTISLTAVTNVDVPIRNASVVNPNAFVQVNQSVQFILQLTAGSRVKYCIDCVGRGNHKQLASNVTLVTITHAYAIAGQHSVIVKLWNSVSPVTVTAVKPLTVQYPIVGIQIFAALPKRCPSLGVAICLNLTKNTQPPSNASVLVNYGDKSNETFEISHLDGRMCFRKHRYIFPGIYNITATISNQVSNRTFVLLNVQVQGHLLKGISVSFLNSSVLQKGLGPSNSYFPYGFPLKFEIEANGNDVSYDWRIGTISLGTNRTIENIYLNSECHNVTVVVKSLTFDEECVRQICIEETFQDLNFSVSLPTFFKDPTIFQFSVKNNSIPSWFLLNFGDNASISFGSVACGGKFQNISSYAHEYEARGNYTASLTRWNHVSKITKSLVVFIWDKACDSVEINITGGGLKNRPVIVKGSEELVLYAYVNHKCHVAQVASVDWSVLEWTFGGEGHRVDRLRQEIKIRTNSSQHFKSEFILSGLRLATGNYMVRITVDFTGNDRDLRNITGSNSTWFVVSRPPLVAWIKGGISRSVSWNEKFVLDGSNSRNAWNTLAKLQYSWLCRLITSSYPMATNVTSYPWSSIGCLHNGSDIIGNSSILVVDSKELSPLQEYVFRLEVREGTRASYAEQNVFVLDGPVPTLDLSCVLNCEEMVNPSKRLLLESKCLNCEVGTRIQYQWSVYICNKTLLSCQMLPNFRIKTSTGLQSANLAIKENALEIGAIYRVRCAAWKLGSPNAGYVEYLLTVNSPPINGQCSVMPKRGFALDTLFHVSCSGWWDKEKPITYFVEMQSDNYQTHLAYSHQSSQYVYLPAGAADRNFSLDVIVKVADGQLFSTTTLHSVQVSVPTFVNYSKIIKDVQRAADSNLNDNVFGLVLSLCSIMNLNQSRGNTTTNSKVRLEIGQILASTNTTDLQSVQGVSDAFEALTAKPDEISPELQNEVTESIQRKKPIIQSLVNMSRDISVVGTSLHRVLSNIVGAALLTSVDTVTMGTNTSGNDKDNIADMKTKNIQNTFQTVDEINSLLLQQVLPGDKSTSIQTNNYDIKLAKRRIEDLVMNDKLSVTKFPIAFQDAKSLVKNSSHTAQDILGLMVTDLSKTPSRLYGMSAEEINTNILRVNVKDSLGLPVDMADIDLNVFVTSSQQNLGSDIFSLVNTLHSRNSIKIHRFNGTVPESGLVMTLRGVDSSLFLRAFLSVGQRPTFKEYSLTTEVNTTGDSTFSWVVSREVLRNITEFPESQEYFLGLASSGGMGLVNQNYSFHVAWVKCLLLEEGKKVWSSTGCEVGHLTSSERTHCVCRPDQTDYSKRAKRSTDYSRKKSVKIAVGAGVFPTPNKINFDYVFDANIADNPLTLIAVSIVFGVYLLLLVYARRRDRKDSEKIGVTALPNKSSDKYFYEVTTYTGSIYDAGTSAHVSITLNATERDLGPKLLYDPTRQCFQRSSIDTFLISSSEILGDLSYLQIQHDNTGLSPSWFLDKIVVRDLNNRKSYIFYNETWLAVENEKIRSVLFPACKDEITHFKRLFNSTIHSNLKDRHLWFSLLSRPVDSRFTLVQRLSCCLSLLYTTMLVNAMFYQVNEAITPDSSLVVGPFIFGLREVVVGVVSAFIIVPVNAGIVWLFRNVKSKPCEDEIKASFSTLVSRNVGDYFYDEDGINLGGEDKDGNPQSTNARENPDFPVEISNDRIILAQKPKNPSTSFKLPYLCIYISWSLVFLSSITSAFFVVLYGLQFGRVVSSQWLSSMTVSFMQDVFITEPLKVFAIAVVVALIIKKPQNSHHMNERHERTDHNILRNPQDLEERFIHSNVDEDSEFFHVKVPDRKDLEMAKNKRLKELRTGALLKELCLYALFLFCLSAVTYRNKDPTSFQVNKTMRDLLVEGNSDTVGFNQVSNMNDLRKWYNDTFLNAMCLSYYKPKPSSVDDQNTVFSNFHLVGYARMRLQGEIASSTNDPIIMDVRCSNRSDAVSNLNNAQDWLSTRSRELSIKFNLYSPSTNLFCLSKLTVNVLPTNNLETRANFVIAKLFAIGGIFDTFSLVCHIFVLVFLVVFTYRELKQVYRLKKAYFKSIWNILQGILVFLILSCVVFFCIRLQTVEQLLDALEENQKRFIHFEAVVFVDNILANLIAFMVFFSWLRALKFLKFNRRLSFLQDTLGKMVKPLATYSVVFLTVFFAYMHSGYLLFSRELEAFHDLKSTLTSLCSLFMAKFDFPSLQNSNRIIGPIFLFSALFFGGFIILNLLIALILESFLLVKTTHRANQYELLEYIKRHLRYWFGAIGENTPRNFTPTRTPVQGLALGKSTLREKSQQDTTCDDTRDKISVLETCLSKQETSLTGVEKEVSDLMTSLEYVCAEDWHEEVFLHRLMLKDVGLKCWKCLSNENDSENLKDFEMAFLRDELYEAVEKYSQEQVDRDQNPRGLESNYEECKFSMFDLDFEEEMF